MTDKNTPKAQRGKPAKRQRWQTGAVVEIPLGLDSWAYGQLGEKYFVGVFDGYFAQRPDTKDVIQLPLLFKTFIYSDVVAKGYWLKIGKAEPRLDILKEDYRFKQDHFSGALSLWHSDFAENGWERPARLSECIGLERAAVWKANHVEDRIIAMRSGQECKRLSSMAIDLSRVPAHQMDLH